MENSDSVFDRVLHSVGDDGKFQRRYNIVYNVCLAAASTMVYMNLVLAMTVPDHWCFVPGRMNGNYSLEEWKSITIPKERDSSGQEVFSSCKMFNISASSQNYYLNRNETIKCQNGYEYDTTWYLKTVPSSQDWVCEKKLHVSNVFAITKLGEVIAGFVFGYLGDTIGRRPVHLLSLVISCTGRIASSFLAGIYPLFLAASVVATIPSTTGAQSCQVILMEISPIEDRAFIAQMQNVGWTLGLSILPLIFWILQDWVFYILITTLPLLIYIPLCMFLIESPRWLLSRGRVAECIQQLMRIAKVNGTRLSPDSSMLLNNTEIKPEKTYGIGSLFSSWRLAKNTVLMVTCWICSVLSYFTLVLSVTSLSGNPFINFFLQSIAELPSYILGKILCEKFGRRSTGGLSYIIAACSLASIILMVNDPKMAWLQVGLTVIAKFAVSMCYFVSALQSLEIYPTCVRQSGFSFGLVCANTLSIFGPYIVYLGVTFDARMPYLILTIFCITGMIMQILLPETLHEKLPESLQEARTFGADQDYWSIPHKKKDLYVLANLKTVHHQISENCDSIN